LPSPAGAGGGVNVMKVQEIRASGWNGSVGGRYAVERN